MTTSPATIERLETRFWQSMVDKDPETAMTMIADESIVAGPMGVMKITPEKYGEMTRDGKWSLKTFDLDAIEVAFPTEEVAVIAYKVHQTGDMDGQAMDLRCADTSTWVKQGGEWKCSMHTETILDHMPLTN